MSYIEFTTRHRERTYGNPVHDGKRPARFRDVIGVRVDGELQQFVDDTIPLRLQHYLGQARQLRRRKIANDCVAFVASMQAIELEDPQHNPYANFDAETIVRPGPNVSTVNTPLVLARNYHDGLRIPAHVILPAHLVEGPNFLHKLGDNGPLCMSNLRDAMLIMSTNTAHPVNVSVGQVD